MIKLARRKGNTMSSRRRHEDDGDDEVDAKRRRGPPEHSEVERKLQDLIARVGEKSGSTSLESNLESLCSLLEADLDRYRSKIIDIIAVCIVSLPEKLTIYSTLVGLLNAKNFNFGGEIVEKLVSDLQDKLEAENYQHSQFIILFLCELGNCKVLTLSSIAEFLESLVQAAYEEFIPQVRSDWFIYTVLHCLPWIGAELAEKRKDELANIMEASQKYIEGRKKDHVPMLRVWLSSTPHEQEDYLDSLWTQISRLQAADWKEKHIQRHYVAFDAALQDALQHNLPSFTPPMHRDEGIYPYPSIVFRLFDYADCPEDGSVLPGAQSIERFLIEEELTWIVEFNCFDRKVCAEDLLAYAKGSNVPINYMILEVIFGQLFRLPAAPQPAIFYGSLLIELCKLQPNAMPQVLAQAAELLYQRAEGMQATCIDRMVDWFSYHLSNFQYRWSWTDWNDCLAAETWNPKYVFARETLEKCMRFSYYDRVVEIVPEDFGRVLPAKPDIRYTLDDENEPGHELAKSLSSLFQSRAGDDVMLAQLRGADGEFDQQSFAVFFAVILKLAAKSISHNFAALARYHRTLKEVADVSEDFQTVVLRTLYSCWKTNHQIIIIMVDKLLKMQILDCMVVVSWLFSDELKDEMDRQWMFEVLNVSLDRLSRHILKVTKDVDLLKHRVNVAQKERPDEEMDEGKGQTRDEEILEDQTKKLENLKGFQRDIFLTVLHKFSVVLTEHIVNCITDGEEMDHRTPYYNWMCGRFKQVFLVHHAELREFTEELGKELFTKAHMDHNVLEVYEQFVALAK